jgi:hypothetical protein
VLNAIVTLSFAVAILNDKNPVVVPHAGVNVLNISKGSVKDILNQAYIISSVLSFATMWVSTTLLLRYFSNTFGRSRYWVSLSIPLAYFLTQFLIIFVDILEPLIETDPTFVNLILTIVFALSRPVGGILFGIAFWIVARKVSSGIIQNYLIISAYGLILFFTANQAVVLVSSTFYPPFGVASVLYVGLSSYLILIGIYFSAISISQDKKILSDIRRSALKELRMLESIGSAEDKQKILNRAASLAKKTQADLVAESGVYSSLNEEGIMSYLDDVLKEMGSQRKEKHLDDDA